MTELFETEDVHDRRLVRDPSGLLGRFNVAGLLEAADVHVARRLCAIARGGRRGVALAVGLAVRAVRHGSVCVDLAAVADSLPRAALAGPRRLAGRGSRPVPLAAASVLRVEHDLLYLDRYWREEGQVRDDLLGRAPPGPRRPWTWPGWRRGPRASSRRGYDEQRAAAHAAATPVDHRADRWPRAPARPPRWPGCWRCWPSSRRDAAADRAERAHRARRRPGCRRPSRTRTAAARPGGPRPAGPAHRPDPAPAARLASRQQHPLPAPPRQPAPARRGRRRRDLDGVADDDGPAASRRCAADARLLLVGDPDQLASVEAGAVLSDLVSGPRRAGARSRRGAAHLAPLRGPDRGAGRGAARSATPTGCWGCCARADPRSS